MATYSNVSNQVAALKELYTGDDYMKDLVYKKNPFLALVPKDESPAGLKQRAQPGTYLRKSLVNTSLYLWYMELPKVNKMALVKSGNIGEP